MGCDIHIFGEHKKDGKWLPCEPWGPSKDDPNEKEVPYHLQMHRDRCYNWFAFLANVRNSTWGEDTAVASEPRGLPEDCCPEVKQCSDGWGTDGHSHSHFTAAELEEKYAKVKDWNIEFHGSLFADDPSPDLAAWLAKPDMERGAPPRGFSAGAWRGGVAAPKFRWREKVSDLIGGSYHKAVEYLRRASWHYEVGMDEVRIVFWFDN